MSCLTYLKVDHVVNDSEVWPYLGVPSIFSAFQRGGGTLARYVKSVRKADPYDADDDGHLISRSAWALNFKTAAYNYLPIFVDIPPKLDEQGSPGRQTEMGTLWFNNSESRDLALGLLAGKWGFAWWSIYGDDFHVTGGLLTRFPVDLENLSNEHRQELLKLSQELRIAMKNNPTVKRNKGMIYNWYLPGCRAITDQIDVIWSQIFGGENLQDNLQLQYFGTVKTDQTASETLSMEDC